MTQLGWEDGGIDRGRGRDLIASPKMKGNQQIISSLMNRENHTPRNLEQMETTIKAGNDDLWIIRWWGGTELCENIAVFCYKPFDIT